MVCRSMSQRPCGACVPIAISYIEEKNGITQHADAHRHSGITIRVWALWRRTAYNHGAAQTGVPAPNLGREPNLSKLAGLPSLCGVA